MPRKKQAPMAGMQFPTAVDNPDQEAAGIVERTRLERQERIAGKVETLADKLLDNAHEVLENDNATLKEKEFTIKVLDKTVKMVQGNEALRIKRGQEKRENANFLVELLRKARSGQIAPEDRELITSVATQDALPDA